MIRLSLALVLLLVAPQSVFAKVEKDIANLEKCNATGIGSMGIAFKLTDGGHLEANELFKMAKLEKGDGVETMTYNDPFELTKGKTVITMKKDDKGRPVSVETKYDPNSPFAKGVMGAEGTAAQGSRFAYTGKDCSVSQNYRITASGKEMIDYDATLCGKILDLGEKAVQAHLMQCKATFAQVWDAIHKAEKQFSQEGKEWSGMGMAQFYKSLPGGMKKDEEVDHDWQAIGVVGVCNLYQSMYGKAPAVMNMMPFMAPVGGGGFGAGMGTPFAPVSAPNNSAE